MICVTENVYCASESPGTGKVQRRIGSVPCASHLGLVLVRSLVLAIVSS
jgi:hypothetical protein